MKNQNWTPVMELSNCVLLECMKEIDIWQNQDYTLKDDQISTFIIMKLRKSIKQAYNNCIDLSIDRIKQSIEQEIAYRVYSGLWF